MKWGKPTQEIRKVRGKRARMRMFLGFGKLYLFCLKYMKYFLLEAIYDTLILASTLNMNCYRFFNRLVVVTSNRVDVN